MFKKVFAILIAQLYIFSAFGVNLHQCLCCGEDPEVVTNCSLEHGHEHTSFENDHTNTCKLCPHSARQSDPCNCAQEFQDEDCDGTSFSFTSEIHKKNKPHVTDVTGSSNSLVSFLPVLISHFFFQNSLEFEELKIERQVESSIFKLYKQSPLFIEFCVYRN